MTRHGIGATRRFAFVIGVGLAVLAAACGDSVSPSTSVSAVNVSGSVPAVGTTSQLDAVARMSDGTSQDVTSTAIWQSSNTDLATVSSTGIVTALASGTVVVQATFGGSVGSLSLTIQ